ncbi:MAG TPA: hypothetical protein VF342_08900 [Alphaproteobacteria bacterium]
MRPFDSSSRPMPRDLDDAPAAWRARDIGSLLTLVGASILAANRPGMSFGEAVGRGVIGGLDAHARLRERRQDARPRARQIGARQRRRGEVLPGQMPASGDGPAAGAAAAAASPPHDLSALLPLPMRGGRIDRAALRRGAIYGGPGGAPYRWDGMVFWPV